jgi:hypothetical protein
MELIQFVGSTVGLVTWDLELTFSGVIPQKFVSEADRKEIRLFSEVIFVSAAIGIFPLVPHVLGLTWLDDSLVEVDFDRWLVASEFVVTPELHNGLKLFSPMWSGIITCMCQTG